MPENDHAADGEPREKSDRPFPPVPRDGEVFSISAEAFQESFGEDIHRTLNLETWRIGSDVNAEYSRIEREVRDAVAREDDLQRNIRTELFPRLKTALRAPKNAGVHPARRDVLKDIHERLLFSGGVEACDGTTQVHSTLPLTIFQIGVCLLSYQGDQGAYGQRLFHRDLRQKTDNPVQEVLDILERRARRNGSGSGEGLGELARKAIQDYGERAILLRHSRAPWRMGHGNPITYELLTGGGNLELMAESAKVLRELVEIHQKFVFVASEPHDRMLLTIGQALHPMEYAIVSTLDEQIEDWVHQRRFAVNTAARVTWDQEVISAAELIPRLIERVASKIVVGLFRATQMAPAQMFYAHIDHADLAAHIVLADSMLQDHKGFPLLADMTRRVCKTVFGDTLEELSRTAFAAAGVPWRYLANRIDGSR